MTILTPLRYKSQHRFHEFDSVFSDLARAFQTSSVSESFVPIANVLESEKNYRIELEVPGIDKKDINISFKNHVLSVEGKREDLTKQRAGAYTHIESRYGTFKRQWSFEDIEAAKIDASFENGVLRLTLPKRKEVMAEERQKIEIKS